MRTSVTSQPVKFSTSTSTGKSATKSSTVHTNYTSDSVSTVSVQYNVLVQVCTTVVLPRVIVLLVALRTTVQSVDSVPVLSPVHTSPAASAQQ
jgi:hypothetical protein